MTSLFQISCVTKNLVSDANSWVNKLTVDATSDVDVLAQALQLIVSNVGQQLGLIIKDIVDCV